MAKNSSTVVAVRASAHALQTRWVPWVPTFLAEVCTAVFLLLFLVIVVWGCLPELQTHLQLQCRHIISEFSQTTEETSD